MNFNNFTIKSQEAVQEAVNLVQSRGQQAIEPEHLMAGLLKVGEKCNELHFQKLGIKRPADRNRTRQTNCLTAESFRWGSLPEPKRQRGVAESRGSI